MPAPSSVISPRIWTVLVETIRVRRRRCGNHDSQMSCYSLRFWSLTRTTQSRCAQRTALSGNPRRREEIGFSYFVFDADFADALAPVVAELAGG